MNDPNSTLDTPRPRSLPLVGGLAVGGGLALMAFAGGWLLHRPEAVTVQVPRAPTESELAVNWDRVLGSELVTRLTQANWDEELLEQLPARRMRRHFGARPPSEGD